jgi:hypothetical protein
VQGKSNDYPSNFVIFIESNFSNEVMAAAIEGDLEKLKAMQLHGHDLR